jgi:hypothetical protein
LAPNTTNRRSAIDGRTSRHTGHALSQRLRKRIDEPFGWLKTVAGGRKLRYKGRQRNRAWLLMAGRAYDIIRIVALRRGDHHMNDRGGQRRRRTARPRQPWTEGRSTIPIDRTG